MLRHHCDKALRCLCSTAASATGPACWQKQTVILHILATKPGVAAGNGKKGQG